MRSGYSRNPSAQEFRKNLQHILSRLMPQIQSANCEPDDDDNIFLHTEIKGKEKEILQEDVNSCSV